VTAEHADPLALRDLALSAAREAAELVAARRRAGVAVAATKSSGTDVVTEADRASEELLRRVLLTARPDDAVLGEEEGEATGTSGVRWVVDPIDGTVNFLYGLPEYAVSVAAEVDGRVVAGAVVNAATGTAYDAALGHGARRDGEALSVRDPAPVPHRLVLTGFSYEAHQRALQADAVARMLPQVRDVRRMGACALDLCHVAEGSADGYLEEGTKAWDHAAGSLVVTEAGGRVGHHPGAGGRPLLLAAPAHGYDELLDLAASCGFLAPAAAAAATRE